MKRRLFNVLAGVSLVLCTAIAVLWVRSYWVADFIKYNRQHQLISSRGGIRWDEGLLLLPAGSDEVNYFHATDSPAQINNNRFSWSSFSALPGAVTTTASGDWSTSFPTSMLNHKTMTMPYWPIVVATALIPLLRWMLLHSRHDGLCRKCGYNLRATPDRCPECGTVPKMTA